MNEAIRVIKERRSVRNYKNKEVGEDILKEIIDCGRLAPNANNMQPWEFIVVNERDKLKRISEIATYGRFIKEAGACIIVCGDKENKHLIEDGCAATENMLLGAKAFGIGSCWVAGWKRDYNNELMKLLEIPDDKEIVSILSLGYSKEEVKAVGKRSLNEVLHWEKY